MHEQMTARERFFAHMNDEDADRPSVINPVSVATTESITALGLDYPSVHLSAEDTAALACYSYEKLGFDSIMPYFSVILEAAALGATMKWGSNQDMPTVRSRVYSEPDEIKIPKDYFDRPAIRSLVDSVKIISKRYGDDALVIGKAIGPWTLSLNTYGHENTLIDTIDDREKLAAIFRALNEFTKVLIEAQLEAGADMVTIPDHTTRNLIGPKVYDDFIKPLHVELNELFPGKLILHCCGFTEDRIELFAEAGFPLYHFESANDISNALKLANGMKFTGCVSNISVLLEGSREDVYNQVNDIVSHGVYLVSPECAVPLRTPNANLKAISDCVKGVDL